jgi:hypothetical protein
VRGPHEISSLSQSLSCCEIVSIAGTALAQAFTGGNMNALFVEWPPDTMAVVSLTILPFQAATVSAGRSAELAPLPPREDSVLQTKRIVISQGRELRAEVSLLAR